MSIVFCKKCRFSDCSFRKNTIFVAEKEDVYDTDIMKDYPDKMTPEQARTFKDDVLNIVSQIPLGYVTTYGHIAALAGWPSHSRMVGRTLRYTPGAELLPCYRVVNNAGRTVPGWSRQRPLLEAEGITFKPNGHVDMRRHLWEPPLSDL